MKRSARGCRCRRADKVYRVRRVRSVDARPFMFEEASMPAALFPDVKDMSSFAHRIVCLAQNHGILLGRAEERISIAAAPLEVAEALSVARDAPVAVLDRVVRTIEGRPVEWRIAWCDLAKNHYLAQMG